MKVVVSIDQLFRPSPGGIASYVRGLLQGLRDLGGELDVRALAPRGGLDASLGVPQLHAPLPAQLLTRAWALAPLGVPVDADVVHATTLAGPFGGGRRGAVHSVALHDLLWRDQPETTTRRGIRFHETRLRRVLGRASLRLFTTAPGLDQRLADLGVAPERLHPVRLGVDDDTPVADAGAVRELLGAHGVAGPYTLYVGTREPRKNLGRLATAHAVARSRAEALGTLVIVGPTGWGEVDTAQARVLGPQSRSMLKALVRDAAVCAYVPLAEGFGLPPGEALVAGTRVVVSRDVPSVLDNAEVVRVDPLDVESIANGLERALGLEDDALARARRSASVGEYTWANCARDHLAGWR